MAGWVNGPEVPSFILISRLSEKRGVNKICGERFEFQVIHPAPFYIPQHRLLAASQANFTKPESERQPLVY